MKTSKACRQITPILETVANGNATEQEKQNVECHTETCAACRAEYQRWQQAAHLVANWRTAVVPESHRTWNDLHARLTVPQPQKLRPVFPLRVGLGGIVGAMAVGIFCLIALRPTPLLTSESTTTDIPAISGLEKSALSENPTVKISLPESQSSIERTTVTDSTRKLIRETPPLTLVKSETPGLPLPREERAKRGVKLGVREKRSLFAQTYPQPKPQAETPRRVILGVDGETVTPDRDDRYTLAAVPSGQASGGETPRAVMSGSNASENLLIPASYSSSGEKTAW